MNKQMNEHHVCPKCGKEFKTLGRVNAHVRVVHPKVKAFQCYKCGKCFATNHILNAHLRNHLNSISKPYLCSFCPKRFAQSHSCKQHETIHKKSDSSFGTYQEKKLCTICHKWIVKSFFNQHLLKHMGLQLKTHVCTICNKQFANKHNLMVHNRIHSRVKPFSCEHVICLLSQNQVLFAILDGMPDLKGSLNFPARFVEKLLLTTINVNDTKPSMQNMQHLNPELGRLEVMDDIY
ncbi:hypothetical protein KUTeg_006379 [Tegillarca granosa]|uniref:C2H2-type domain-containing protein n=1 Tax=Tegillarca granosa TaxID=220873 RepID=A0ABQ9FL03_TEGGR|nr:hypothetical protein KUTeg_006379 [Tegillarca granosa]